MRPLIDWAVEERGIHRLEWVAASGNTASVAVARLLGMTRDGVRREAHLHDGVRHDLEVWSLLAPEWRAAPSGPRWGDPGIKRNLRRSPYGAGHG